jgi:hypothetical protein
MINNSIFTEIQDDNIYIISNSLDDFFELQRDNILLDGYSEYQIIVHRIMQNLDNSVYKVFENNIQVLNLDKGISRIFKINGSKI